MKLEGRVAIVTGASRGIGKAIALALAREGAAVVVAAKTDVPHPKLPGTIFETANEIEAAGGRALPLKVNVREADEIDRMVARTREAFGPADILVNNAGAIFLADAVDTPPGRFDLVMDVNARASFLCSRAVLPEMVARRWGHILMLSPPMSLARAPGKIAYLLSKVGMTFIAQALAEEVRGHQVAVNALWPVTMVESSAVIHFQMGEPSQWRKPEVMADAVVAVVTRDPSARSGQALWDEDVLREVGIADFAGYACVPGTTPPPLSRAFVAAD